MYEQLYFPHIDMLLRALRITRPRLDGTAKVAVDARLLRALIEAAVASTPFSEEFYFQTYPDLKLAAGAGKLTDAHRHYVATGYFEGRLGAAPVIDDSFYIAANPDVARAMATGEVASPLDHYIKSGSAEGRAPSLDRHSEIDAWTALLGQ